MELENLDELKRKLWITYLFKYKELFQSVVLSYQVGKGQLAEIVRKAREERTTWDEVIVQFNERFSNMPFILEVKNYDDVILKGSVANIVFKYKSCAEEKELDRETLLKRLSNGEKKALYLLNVLFEIKARMIEGKEVLLVIDDIADSFDYRNKYAIIEYIKDIVEYGLFKVIILTHNFDFYRTVACRINLTHTSHFAIKKENEIKLEKGEYHKNVFVSWKSHIYRNNIFFIAAIPFIRNIVEYTKGTECVDYKTLTSLLHYKEDAENRLEDTKRITVADLKKIYSENWETESDKFTQDEEETVFNIMLEEAERIFTKNSNPIKIENKIVLSIAIRILSEQFMISRISNKEAVKQITSNQTRELRNLISFSDEAEDVRRREIIERVLIITSENIHLNSFMYEPIVDISLEELKKLYFDVKSL